MKKAVCFLLILSTVLGLVRLESPKQITLLDTTNFLGDVAPGQTVELIFSRSTGGDGEQRAIFWERAISDAPGAEQSTLQGDKISLKVRIPENAKGEYSFTVRLEGTDVRLIVPETKPLSMNVKEDVYTVSYDKNYEINAGETTQININISSNSIASDTLKITSTEGIPAGWLKMDDLYVPFLESRQAILNITPFEEGYYTTKLNLGRASIGTVASLKMNFRVYPTLKSKMKAYSEGFSIVPIILQPFYSLLSLFGWV